MCKTLKLKLAGWPSQKAKRKAEREARGLRPKPGRHERSREFQLSVAIQEDLMRLGVEKRNFI